METLYIPVNIKTRFEFFSGYGVAELAITGLVTLIVGVIAFIIHFAANSVTVPILMTLIAGAATIMITAKDSLNLSSLSSGCSSPQVIDNPSQINNRNEISTSLTTDTWSTSFESQDEKLAFLGKYLIMPSDISDAEYHIVYHDNSGGIIPGPSDWEVKTAVKMSPEDVSLWLDGFEELGGESVDMEWWGGLETKDLYWNKLTDARYFKRLDTQDYLVVYDKEGIVLKMISTMYVSAKITTATETWQDAYAEFLRKPENYLAPPDSYNPHPNARFALRDIDNDGTPELIVLTAMPTNEDAVYICAIYTYTDTVERTGDLYLRYGYITISDNPEFPGLFASSDATMFDSYYLTIKGGQFDSTLLITLKTDDNGEVVYEPEPIIEELKNEWEKSKENWLETYEINEDNIRKIIYVGQNP